MGTNKLALAFFCLVVGCGLSTEGMGMDDGSNPDVGPDEIEPDVPEADTAEDGELDEGVLPDETAEDVAEDIPETAEDSGPEDADEEDEADGEEADDGEIVNPCERPDIPEAGIQMFFCFADDIAADMTLYLQIERGGLPVFPWAEILDCTATGARSMFCELPVYYNAVYIFNVLIPGIGVGWSCGPETDVLWGVPRVWVNHVEQTVSTRANTEGGCNHLFTTPPSGSL